ncbi:hypothetical protein Ancab_034209 [Ancistrocladus abbreviatus]
MDESNEASTFSSAKRPTLSFPPRSATDALFTLSPGSMTRVPSFFSDNFPESSGGVGGVEFRSFSQLLAGAMTSPSTVGGCLSFLGENWSSENQGKTGASAEKGRCGSPTSSSSSGFKQNRPGSLMVPISPLLGVSPAFSPSAFLSSTGFFSPSLSPFGLSHQQALAQVTAQAALSQARCHTSSSVLAPTDPVTIHQSSAFNEHRISVKDATSESVEACHSDRTRSQPLPVAVGKPADDGYNWRKYGQKQVKGSEYPRSYYRCTNPNCRVKKKVERSFDGHIIEIIYKGQHNHEPPQQGRRAKDSTNLNLPAIGHRGDSKWSSEGAFAQSNLGGDEDSAQATSIQLHGPSDSEESGDARQRVGDEDEDEPNAKRRDIGLGTSDSALTHKTVTEPKIIVQTRSEVDLLDDGYRWRKYGQKVVKGNPNPRSYYKCTTVGCSVRKHIERSSTDPKAVITTYEGKHNHDVPVARSSSSSINTAQPAKLQNIVNFGSESREPADFLRLKEERFML